MKHRLTNNWGLKLGSIIFSFFLWIIVTNMNDPVVQYKIYNVPVRLANTDVITDAGMTFEVLEDTDNIGTVIISAPRSVVDSLDDNNIMAVADFNDISASQDEVPIRLSTNKYSNNIESIRGSIDSVKLNIDYLKTKTLALSTITSGTVSDGYVVGNISTAQNQLRISGPETIIDQVVKAEVNVSVTGFTQDINTDADVMLLDAEGNIVESNSIESNINMVKVNVEILETKRMDFEFETMGTPAEGYAATGIVTSDPGSVLVAGRANTLNNLNKIKIGPEALNITGQSDDMITFLNVKDYLPSGVIIADPNFDGYIYVTVYIDATINRPLTVSTEKIDFVNVPSGYEVTLVDPEDEFEVVLNGLSNKVNAISRNDIVATADLTDILDQEDKVGNLYHVTLKFKADDKQLDVSEPVQIWFKLDKT